MRGLKRSIALLLALLLALSAWGIAESSESAEWGPIARGAKGEQVEMIQQRLIELGYLNSGADGIFGSATERALLNFQLSTELEATGIADANTVEALLASNAPEYDAEQAASRGEMVWIPRTGERYHRRKTCSGMKEPTYVTIAEAIERGFTPCKLCYR